MEPSFPPPAEPVARLPVELLQAVFLSCLEDCPRSTEGNLQPSASHAPLILGRISRQWRGVSRACSSLWTSLHIKGYTKDVLDNVHEYKGWLALSGCQSLSIELDIRRKDAISDDWGKFGEELLEEEEHLFHALLPFLKMSQILSLSIPLPLLRRIIAMSPFLRLQTLTMIAHRPEEDSSAEGYTYPEPFRRIQLSTKGPRTIQWHNRMSSQRPEDEDYHCHAQWLKFTSQLLEIQPQYITHVDLAKISTYPWSCASLSLTSVVEFPALVSLRFYASETRTVVMFFDRIFAPVLVELGFLVTGRTIGRVWDSLPWPHTEFAAFLVRCGCPLQKLDVCNVRERSQYASEEEVLVYLDLVPSLVDVEIHCGSTSMIGPRVNALLETRRCNRSPTS